MIRKLNLYLTLALVALTGCRSGNQSQTDYTKEVYAPQYASGFRILGADGKASVIIESKNPWQGAEDATTSLFIQREGESVPAGFKGEVLNKIPERIITMSSTQIAMLEALAATDKVAGVSGLQFITNDNIRQRANTIADVGYDGNINYELMMGTSPDLIMLYGVTGASPMEGKLRELGIPYIYIGEYLEESPLGKVEWVKAIGEIIGKGEQADSVINAVTSEYEQLRDMVRDVTRPNVMLNLPYGDSWFMPSTHSYMATLIEDAGGNYMYKENTGNSSTPIDIELAYNLLSEADVWLNPGSVETMDDMKSSAKRFTSLPVMKSGNIYNNNKRSTPGGGNDFFESGTMNPHIILLDLIKIFHPQSVPGDEEMFYYNRIK
ncbi:MAG: ABC transporter substrate-binding protein [Muribaculaceae bacterium]|nr:ABC transporter substrate-binding protein [Muribaculaceae bacterium]